LEVIVSLQSSIPVYVTRKDADGNTGTYSYSIWMTLLAGFVVWLNVVVWGAVGLVTAVRVIL